MIVLSVIMIGARRSLGPGTTNTHHKYKIQIHTKYKYKYTPQISLESFDGDCSFSFNDKARRSLGPGTTNEPSVQEWRQADTHACEVGQMVWHSGPI